MRAGETSKRDAEMLDSRALRALFGDRHGLVLFLGTVCVLALVWRAGVFITDTQTLLATLDGLSSGRLWIDPREDSYGAVRAAFLEAVKERFDADGIDMPYPNTELSGDLEVRNVDTASADG